MLCNISLSNIEKKFFLGIFLWFKIAGASPETHYQEVLIGEQAAGLGGAYTALGEEATGSYYNPAGIADIKGSIFSVSMSAYRLEKFNAQKVINFCGTTQDLSTSQFFSFPASLGYVRPFRTKGISHALSWTILVPYYNRFRKNNNAPQIKCPDLEQEIGMTIANRVVDHNIWTGLAYAIKPLSWLRIGGGIFYLYRNYYYTLHLGTYVPDLNLRSINFLYAELHNGGLLGQVGVKLSVSRFLFGLVLRTPNIELHDSGQIQTFEDTEGGIRIERDREVNSTVKLPLRIGLGAAYKKPGSMIMAIDLSYNLPVPEYKVVKGVMNEREGVLNFNIGSEWFLSSRFLLRGGFYTNFSSYPKISLKKSEQSFEHLDKFGFTLGATLLSKSTTLTLSGGYSYGFGQAEGVYIQSLDDRRKVIVDISSHTISLMLGGSYGF